MKNTSNLIVRFFCSRISWIILFYFLPFMVGAQSYEQLWKSVDNYKQKDLPRSAMQQLTLIYNKAEKEKNVPQLMKAYMTRVAEQVKLTPDSAEVEMERLRTWAASETDSIAKALLFHMLGNVEMQKNEPDWKGGMNAYRRALEYKELLLKTSACDYAPMTVSTDFSERYFQNNLYDLLVRQTIAGLMTNWQWRNQLYVQEWIIDLYDSLIDAYGDTELNLPMAALLAHEAKIAFLSENQVASQYQLSAEERENSLRDLLRLYEPKLTNQTDAVDVLVDVHLKLAEALCNQQELVEAVTVLKSAKMRYPKSSLIEDVNGKMEWINNPSLMMHIPLVYPTYQGKLVVNYKNLKGVKLETYRLRLRPDSPELNGNLSMEVLCRTYGKKVKTQSFKLPQTLDYKPRIETISYQLPEAGIYVMKATPLNRKGKADYELMYVSPYQCVLIPLLDGHTEVIVLDHLSGNPVPHAEVVEYQRDNHAAQFSSPKVWKTNEQGSVVVNNPKRGALLVNARTAGCDYMKIASFYPGRDYRLDGNQKVSRKTALFTDGALYRPGQVVHVSGIRYEQLGDSLHTLQGQVMKVELLDVNGKKVSEASASTDLFGVFAADLTLPHEVLPGRFTLRTDNKAMSIRVENYKRPTFDVNFSPIEKTYTFEDKVQVEGNVRTFAGAPVRLARGTYSVVRSEAWLWRSGGNESVLTSGSFITDAEGKFSLDVCLEAPMNKHDLDVIPFYRYSIKAIVTDGAGETQERVLTLPVGKRSMGLQIQGLKPKLARERKEKIQFQAMNLNKQLVETEVTYQVLRSGKKVLEGKVMARKSFIPLEIYALPSGEYQLKASACDDQGRLVTIEKDFVLFSLTDKHPPLQTVQWFYQDGDNWNDGRNISLYVGSSEKNIYLMMDVFSSKERIRSERTLLDGNIRRFDFSYDERYGDGIVVSLAFLHEGKFYTRQVKLEKPKPQKNLTMKWETFRDQLTPGQKEIWRMKITDHTGQAVEANLLGAMYDASLDKLEAHQWHFYPSFHRWIPYIGVRSLANDNRLYFYLDFPFLQNWNGYPLLAHDTYSKLFPFTLWNKPYYFYATSRMYAAPMVTMKKSGVPAHGSIMNYAQIESVEDEFMSDDEDNAVVEVQSQEELTPMAVETKSMYLRHNFGETAFYYPSLRTDENGEVSISFTLPDVLTEWKFMGLAHTQQMDYGMLTSNIKASKPFMVQPNLPRFVRVGDVSTLAASLVNLSMKTVVGKVRMELIDPMTEQVVFKQVRDFEVAEGETDVAQFNYKVVDHYDVLVCRVVAEAGEFTDGEQHYLPVLNNKEWVTETIPFQLDGNESMDVSLKQLFNWHSGTATGKRLTIELTANPSWYVIQALPVVGNPTHDDAISWAVAYYANTLAVQLVQKYPQIKRVFDAWLVEAEKGSNSQCNAVDSFWSKLSSNADLKNLLLEETPWLAEAQTEAEQKRRIALLFELNTMEQRLQLAERQLSALQTAEGGWTWYPGMSVNRYTTTQVVELFARLKSNGISLNPLMNEAYLRGLNYLQREVKKEYERMQGTTLTPSEQTIRYLYICAIDSQINRSADTKINHFMIDRLLDVINQGGQSLTIYQKALMAIIMQTNNQAKMAEILLQSVKEYLVSTPEMGSYFDTHKATYSWNSYRIPTHVAAMEAIYRLNPDTKLLNGMKQWLLKQKQVQVWNTPLATVDAIYAFLLNDRETNGQLVIADQLVARKMQAHIGDIEVTTPDDVLGYTRTTLLEAQLPSQRKRELLHVEKTGTGLGWGAVYAQYLEQMDRIKKTQDKGIAIERTYWLNGQLVTANTRLKVGDQLTIRLDVKVNRDMDFLIIKDSRPACMEPADQLTGYVWMNGIAAYRVNRDASTEYFIDKLPKGIHVLEYNVYISQTGIYQSGSASIQSAYAPEFSSHTSGKSLVIE